MTHLDARHPEDPRPLMLCAAPPHDAHWRGELLDPRDVAPVAEWGPMHVDWDQERRQ